MSRKTFTQYWSETAKIVIRWSGARIPYAPIQGPECRVRHTIEKERKEEKKNENSCVTFSTTIVLLRRSTRSESMLYVPHFGFSICKAIRIGCGECGCVTSTLATRWIATNVRNYTPECSNSIATLSNKKSTLFDHPTNQICSHWSFSLYRTLCIVNQLKSAGTQHIIDPWQNRKCKSSMQFAKLLHTNWQHKIIYASIVRRLNSNCDCDKKKKIKK